MKRKARAGGKALSREALVAALAERERELAEARREQAATAEVLRVISRSKVDLDAVLTRLADSARLLCGAANSAVHMRDGDLFRVRAQAGCSPEFVAYQVDHAINPASEGGGRTHIGRAALTGEVAEIADVLEAPDRFRLGRSHELGNFRAILGVPLLRDGRVEGVFSLARPTPGSFPREQIELVRTFADQAMIAIENARLFAEVESKTRDLEESLAQQTATAEVLKTISRSAFDLQAVLDTLTASAVSLCGAFNGVIYLQSGDTFQVKAVANEPSDREVFRRLREAPQRPGRGSVGARVLLTGEVHNVPDIQRDADYDPALRSAIVARALLGVPLKRNDAIIGAFVLARREAGPYSQRQVELVQTFADQAVIAIESARLFGEVQESLQRETASSEILRVISRSPTDARPVFAAIVAAAVQSLRCDQAFMLLRDGDVVNPIAGATPQGPVAELPPEVPIDPEANFPSRAVLTGQTLHVPDWSQVELPEHERNIRERFGFNSGLFLPLMRDGECVGVIVVAATRSKAFGPKEIAQAESFRDQALIAIENARLFNETREALEREKASGEVLSAISRSVSDASPVFDQILDGCERLIVFESAAIFLVDEERQVRPAAARSARGPAAVSALKDLFPQPIERTPMHSAFREGGIVIFRDVANDPDAPWSLRAAAAADKFGNFSLIAAPMMWEGRGIGAIHLSRPANATFTDKEMALLKTFADQAAIAIQNARLFDAVQAKTRDLEESLAQQTATADVLKVISRSAFDLQVVFRVLVENAVRLCGARTGMIFQRDGDLMRLAAAYGATQALTDYVRDHPFPASGTRQAAAGRALLERRTVQILDVETDPDYHYGAW
ncbi:MAG: GAF domain-containing protein, partial [Hyphomicrobiales bacterium]|nr:GAF domain-containing protein [Hyphomicrobiales bacterium]